MINSLLEHKSGLVKAFFETNYMVFSAMFIAFIFSIILGSLLYLLKDKGKLKFKILYHLLSFVLNTLRSVPFLIFIFLLIPMMRFIFKTSFGNTAAILPLSLVGISIYSRFVEQALILVPSRIKQRAMSMGADKLQTLFYFLYPSIVSELILSFTSVFISILSYSTVMGVIGAGGLGEYAFRYGYQEYDTNILYLTAIFFAIYVLVIQSIGYLLAKLNN